MADDEAQAPRDGVALLLYPGCVFFELALAAETLAPRYRIACHTPDGADLRLANGTLLRADGDHAALAEARVAAVLVPGGDPRDILLDEDRARAVSRALQAQAARGAWIAGICAGNLVMAAAGLLAGRRGTHNYTAEHAPPEKVAATAPYWQGMHFQRADLVQDGRLITAQPWAYRRYAAAVALALGVLDEGGAADLLTYPERRRYADG